MSVPRCTRGDVHHLHRGERSAAEDVVLNDELLGAVGHNRNAVPVADAAVSDQAEPGRSAVRRESRVGFAVASVVVRRYRDVCAWAPEFGGRNGFPPPE